MTRVLVVAAALVLAAPAPALAHGNEGGGLVSHVEQIEPDLGLEATASADGDFTLDVPAGKTVLVDASDEDPARRFDGGKVYERVGGTWRKVADGTSYTWHDHRTHWEGSEPEIVEREPGEHHHIRDWTIGGSVDGARFTIHGAIEWEPKSSGPGLEWISYVAIAGGVLYAAFLLAARRRSRT